MPGTDFWSTTKPPAGIVLDRAHPLAQGLLGAWIFAERSGNQVLNVVNGRRYAFAAGAAFSPAGARFVEASSQYLGGPVLTEAQPTYYQQSMFAICTPTSVVTARKGIFASSSDATNNNAGVALMIRDTIDGDLSASWGDGAGSVAGDRRMARSAAGTVVVNQRVALGASIVDQADIRLFKNGAVVPIAATAGTCTAAVGYRAAGSPRVGESRGFYFDGEIEVVYWWGRALTAAEQAQIASEPYCIFAPPAWARYFVPAAAPGPPPPRRRSTRVWNRWRAA